MIFFNISLLGFTNNPSPSTSKTGISSIVSIRPFVFAFRSVDYSQQKKSMSLDLRQNRFDNDELIHLGWRAIIYIQIGGDDDTIFRPNLLSLSICIKLFREDSNCLHQKNSSRGIPSFQDIHLILSPETLRGPTLDAHTRLDPHASPPQIPWFYYCRK